MLGHLELCCGNIILIIDRLGCFLLNRRPCRIWYTTKIHQKKITFPISRSSKLSSFKFSRLSFICRHTNAAKVFFIMIFWLWFPLWCFLHLSTFIVAAFLIHPYFVFYISWILFYLLQLFPHLSLHTVLSCFLLQTQFLFKNPYYVICQGLNIDQRP